MIPAIALLLAIAVPILSPAVPRSSPVQFIGLDVPLERAIEADSGRAVDAAIAAGANPNARGAHGTTPLEFALGTFRKQAARALVRNQADPNLKDEGGHDAVTVAATGYRRDPELLVIALDAGGNPNTKLPDGSPLITLFCSDRNLDAITYLHRRGASVDTEYNGQPLVVAYAYSVDWDIVWHLIQLGARTDTSKAREGLVASFGLPSDAFPDSPLYPAKVKIWKHLKAEGLNPTPPAGM